MSDFLTKISFDLIQKISSYFDYITAVHFLKTSFYCANIISANGKFNNIDIIDSDNFELDKINGNMWLNPIHKLTLSFCSVNINKYQNYRNIKWLRIYL